MAQETRTAIYPKFEDGAKPTGKDFSTLIDSNINILDDPISIDTNGNIVFENAIGIGTTTADTLGSVRFNGSVFEFREVSGWEQLGSGGAFAEVGGGPSIAFDGGNVGINTGATPTNYMLEVRTGVNSSEANRVRFGSAVIHDSQTNVERAYFSHYQMADNTNYALRHDSGGSLQINTPVKESIRFSIGSSNTQMAVVSDDGQTGRGYVVIGSALPGIAPNSFAAVRLFVEGEAYKTGGGTWLPSDMRLKKDVSNFKNGLDIIDKINPIKFKYNGKAWTTEGNEIVGISGQEIEKHAPYMVSKVRVNEAIDKKDKNEYLLVNSEPLIYIAINAIKELSERLNKLEKRKGNG